MQAGVGMDRADCARRIDSAYGHASKIIFDTIYGAKNGWGRELQQLHFWLHILYRRYFGCMPFYAESNWLERRLLCPCTPLLAFYLRHCVCLYMQVGWLCGGPTPGTPSACLKAPAGSRSCAPLPRISHWESLALRIPPVNSVREEV